MKIMRSLQFYTGSREEKIEEFTEEFYPEPAGRSKEQIKQMMNYIQENYAEKLTVSEIASAAFICERECYRIFRKCLQMTPTEYLTGFRIQTACRMLEEGRKSITEIALDCGMGSGSYFGKVFRKYQGVSPLAYRDQWRDFTK